MIPTFGLQHTSSHHKITMSGGGPPDATRVRSLPSQFKNLNQHSKRAKLNVYTPPNPDTPSIHASYTFVSRSQGFDARSSHILGTQSSQSTQQVEASLTQSTEDSEALVNDFYYGSSEGQELDIEVEAEAASNKRKRTAHVSVFLTRLG